MKCAFFASVLCLGALGCGAPVMLSQAPTPRSLSKIEVVLPAHGEVAKAAPGRMQEPGDFVVYRFSGSYREAPVTVTQQVVARRDGVLVVDVTIDDRGTIERLRLRIADVGARQGELISVARLQGDRQLPFGVAAYSQLMSEIALTADENDGLVDATTKLVDVAGHDFYCDVSSYRVRVGAHEAVMTTVESDEFSWGHVGGEIATSDGQVLYKAEIVDMGRATEGQVAAQEDIEIYEDDYDHLEQ